MKTILKSGTVDIPDGVKVEVSSRVITVTGPRGKVSRNLKHLPIDITYKTEKTIQIDRWFTYGKQAACIRTACSHINNMIIGITKVRPPSRDGCLSCEALGRGRSGGGWGGGGRLSPH